MEERKEQLRDEILGRWINGESSPEDLKLINNWAEKDNENRILLDEMTKTGEDIDLLSLMESIDSRRALTKVWKRISGKAYTRQAEIKPGSILRRIAAVILIPLALFSLYHTADYYLQNRDRVAGIQVISTPPGLRSEYTLPDGSKVWLNGNTSISFPERFSGNERLVELEGEACFQVISDRKNPFVVKAGDYFVQATGTSFNISAYPGDEVLETSLLEGKVNILRDAGKDRRYVTDLEAGELFIRDFVNQKSQILQGDLDKYVSWRENRILFSNDKLSYVLRELGLWYNVDFTIEGDIGTAYSYTGAFEGESLQQILEYIEYTTPIEFIISEPKQLADSTFVRRTINVIHK